MQKQPAVMIHTNSFATLVNRIQAQMPITVGSAAASPVHFQLPVSFLIVSRVVEQGQCISEKSMTLTAVTQVHPLATNSCFISARLPSSRILPWAMYAIIIIGTTISFAGKPRINAMSMTPS